MNEAIHASQQALQEKIKLAQTQIKIAKTEISAVDASQQRVARYLKSTKALVNMGE